MWVRNRPERLNAYQGRELHREIQIGTVFVVKSHQTTTTVTVCRQGTIAPVLLCGMISMAFGGVVA